MLGVLVFVVGAGTASAQSSGQLYKGYATGFVGAALGGDLNDPVMSVGGNVAVQESSGWGAEVDFAVANDNTVSNLEADITTLSVGITYLGQKGPIRPYGTAGVGTFGVHGCLLPCSRVTTTWNLGLNLGGGAQYDLNDLVGVRADLRFMIAPGSHAGTSRPGNWAFWRLSFGVTYGWTIQ